MNRGSTVLGPRPVAGATSFNEAPIHESGKCRRARYPRHQLLRFNEAPIHESGKSPLRPGR